ncbi:MULTISPECIES: dihydrofolate reductase family protein [unclassified Lactobacillus]|uniref:dihydrofolate reductase family protein n=1 Tax=unclassified Lactobacillus TaxID=2620435 RepID=UPI000EFB7ED9|nr:MULTISPECIES: dihydrofolate reductase family protein [unclassified Lactobacillus]RMC25685.1 deaminase [Lactobacillus sp. ESL0247]RMC29508.1 deaminase [Lactobacillus sp. ESL0246]RMC33363.1 deaminase [Lactobacillus sp. ESL0245]
MNRAKVVVHMYVTIDGKIDGKCDSPASSKYYNDELFVLSNADGNGRRTIQMYAAPELIDLTQYSPAGIKYEDWLPDIQAATWIVAFDRKGKCGWNKNYFLYHNHQMRAIEVVTKKAQKEYLAFLRTMEIPYIVSGDENFNLKEVLVKLRAHFGIEKLALCGGARINGVFLEQHLVDEISLVVSPYVNGDREIKAVFETTSRIDDQFKIDFIKKLPDGGLHLIFKKTE